MADSTVRAWLEETADRLMQGSEATLTYPHGVVGFKREHDVDTVETWGEAGFATHLPGPERITFIAVLANGAEITTTRGGLSA